MKVLNYKIDSILTTKFDLQEIESTKDLRFSVSFQYKINIEDSVICCISEFEYKKKDDTVMSLGLECYFKILNDGIKHLIKGNKLVIDVETLQYLATIAVGTARGEIHARCDMENSPLKDIVLPPINLTRIITTPSEFSPITELDK